MVRLAPSMTMLITELAKATGEVPGSNPGGPIYSYTCMFRCIESSRNWVYAVRKNSGKVRSTSRFFYSLFPRWDAESRTAKIPDPKKISNDSASRDQ